ncbi:MAG: glycosyl transferase [Flavipsychrobacter sp.]|nr:glycosyl transferase [Flavipsychrobacter sp.]
MVVIICSLLTVCYVLLMAAYCTGWQRQKTFTLPVVYKPSTFISIIIPARNESLNIGACIEAILAQKYPLELFEVIVVDDHSEDDTAAVVNEYADSNVRCISLADQIAAGTKVNAYKKAAIAAGIAAAKGTLIVTTDADCSAPNSWLMHIAAIYEQQDPVMIVAPVIFSSDHSVLQLFQLIDFMSMQGITAAAHSMKLGNMSNGANLAFSKAAYEQVGGYEGIEHLASGDDYLLMMKMNKVAPQRIAYLKSANAIVSTTPQPDWSGFLQQRIRWASKSGKYNDAKLTGILLLVYLFNLSFLVLLVTGIFYPHLFFVEGVMLAVKIISEYIFIVPVARFFRRSWVLPFFPLLQPLHILYIIAAGLLGFIGNYKWKGRKVK